MDIEKKLDTIVEKYHLIERTYFRDSLSDIICTELKEAIKKYGNKIVVRGVKYHENGDYSLCKLVENVGNITAVVDQNPFSDKLVISSEKTVDFFGDLWNPSKEDCDIYLIDAVSKGRNIYYEVKEKLEPKGIYVIDLYRDLRIKHSIIVDRSFDDYRDEYDYTYNLLGQARKDFLLEKSLENLKKVLGTCLIVRDFVSFFKYAAEEEERIKDDEDLQKLRAEVDSLLKEIRDRFCLRGKSIGNKDIMIHWVDQVSYNEGKLLPQMRAKMQDGVDFENAYTHTPYTQPAVRMIFWKEFRKEGNGGGRYEERELKDSELYQGILSEGYGFEVCGYLNQILYKDYSQDCNKENVASGMHYFRMMNRILNSEKPVVGIVHILNETHEPYMSPEADGENRAFEFYDSYGSAQKKIELSAQYIDDVIDFYDRLLGKNVINIYMSDHGKWEDIDRRRFKDEAMHTLLGITNIGVCGKVKRLFCYQDFSKLMRWVLQMAKPEEMFFNDIPIYSEGFKTVIRERTKAYEEICAGYCGLNFADEKYVCLENGTEYYYKKSDGESRNYIADEECRERVEYLRFRCRECKKSVLEN